MRADGGSKGRAKDQPFLMRTMSLYRFTAYRMDSRKGRANGPAHPYMHRRRRSGRSPALPYPPRRRAKLYHEVQQCGQYTLTFRKPFRVLFYLRQRYPFRVHFYVRQQGENVKWFTMFRFWYRENWVVIDEKISPDIRSICHPGFPVDGPVHG